MTSILYRPLQGFAGDVSRPGETTVEPIFIIEDSLKVPNIGAPVKVVDGKAVKIEVGDDASDFYGVMGRIVPAISGDLDQSFNSGIYGYKQCQGVVVRGYVNVICTVGTPARNGAVYMRVVAAKGKAIGDFEATADGSNNVLLTNVIWTIDGKDSDNVSEIRIKY